VAQRPYQISYEKPYSHYLVIKCQQTIFTGEEERLGKARWSWVSDIHVQIAMATGVTIIIPPRDFQYLSRWYYKVLGGRNYEFGVVTYGIKSIPNFMNFHPGIL
jgi:hypothetical protein